MPEPSPVAPFTALVLAGSRPGGDALAAAHGVPRKALIPIAGVPMLVRVLTALREARSVGRIYLCGIEPEQLAAAGIADPISEDAEAWLPAAAHPSESVVAALDRLGSDRPILVTTGDHALLSAEIVDAFCAAALAAGADVAAGVVEAETVRAAHPHARRTFYALRDGAYTGCNLFAFIGAAGRRAAVAWREVELHRKRPWRVIALLGPAMLVRFALGRLDLDGAVGSLSRRLGVEARAIRLAFAEAGIDVDKPDDVDLAGEILAARAERG